MSYTALYREWRPHTFDDVIEQDYIIKILKNTISSDRIGHAYLFCGTRGTGKTTLAKIFSRAINCEKADDPNPCNECETCKGILSGSILDVIEIDAASNNSVDNIREIRDEVIYSPAKAKYKVYIIDEVHMLSTGAFNALLKTLEEPPSHIVFILATTEPHKLPITILSRCQRYDFKRISAKSIAEQLSKISFSKNVTLDTDASLLMAKLADGAMRDGISILDQCMSLSEDIITKDNVISVVGIVDSESLSLIVNSIYKNNILGILNIIDELTSFGKSLTNFVSDLINYFRNILICKLSNSSDNLLEFSNEALEELKKQINFWSIEELSLIIKNLSELENSIKWSIHPKTLIEVDLIKICDKNYFNNKFNIEEKITALDLKLNKIKDNTIVVESNNINNPQKKQSEKVSDPDTNKNIKKEKYTPKNFLEIWPQILESIKKEGKVLLYHKLKKSNAVLKDNTNVEVIIYDSEAINVEFLNKPENIMKIESILSKHLSNDIKLKYNFRNNNSDANDDEFTKKIDHIKNDKDLNVNIFDDN
ncbi:MAG: DNA polymerase III subunit gamma/tau [Clostridiales bacterium]